MFCFGPRILYHSPWNFFVSFCSHDFRCRWWWIHWPAAQQYEHRRDRVGCLDMQPLGPGPYLKGLAKFTERNHETVGLKKGRKKLMFNKEKNNFLYWYYTDIHPGASLSMSSISDWQLTQDVSGGALTSSCADALPQKGRNLILGSAGIATSLVPCQEGQAQWMMG